ncbi:MAG: hypothetical protein NTV84_00025 [Methanoregula sp.]|nr:hypothetical protein [Methanoregula sp.]
MEPISEMISPDLFLLKRKGLDRLQFILRPLGEGLGEVRRTAYHGVVPAAFFKDTEPIVTIQEMYGYVYPAFAAREGTPATSQKVTPAMLRNTASGGDRAVMPRNTQTPTVFS